MSLLCTSNFLSLTPYADKISGDHQRKFWCSRSNTDHIFCFCHFEKMGI